jgi:hypothetical protein
MGGQGNVHLDGELDAHVLVDMLVKRFLSGLQTYVTVFRSLGDGRHLVKSVGVYQLCARSLTISEILAFGATDKKVFMVSNLT